MSILNKNLIYIYNNKNFKNVSYSVITENVNVSRWLSNKSLKQKIYSLNINYVSNREVSFNITVVLCFNW